MNAPEETNEDRAAALSMMLGTAGTYLREVVEAINATAPDQQRRFELLQLKSATALALATFVQATLGALDDANADDDQADYDAAEAELADETGFAKCGQPAHTRLTEPVALCMRCNNHAGMHARLNAEGEVVRW